LAEFGWVQILAFLRDHAQRYPGMVLGPPETGHLEIGIQEPLRHLWERRAFTQPSGAVVVVSPTQYHCKCLSGPLMERVERLINWNEYDVLLQAFSAIRKQLDERSERWAQRLSGSTFGCGAFDGLLPFAERGVVAIRTSAGLWYQSYHQGWPMTPPLLLSDTSSLVGLMIAAALSPEWHKGLPFTPEAVEAVIPRAARPFTRVEWRPHDEIVPPCPSDPSCILDAGNMARWL
jgi:hypothetical protein